MVVAFFVLLLINIALTVFILVRMRNLNSTAGGGLVIGNPLVLPIGSDETTSSGRFHVANGIILPKGYEIQLIKLTDDGGEVCAHKGGFTVGNPMVLPVDMDWDKAQEVITTDWTHVRNG